MRLAPNRPLSHFFSVAMADNGLKQGFEDPLTLIGNCRGYGMLIDCSPFAGPGGGREAIGI